MNWSEVRKHNAKASQRRAAREARRAQEEARIERAGGAVKIDEIRTAARRTEPPVPGCCHDRDVWTFRGSDWVVCINTDGETFAVYPFRSWRQEPDYREYIPLTTAANRWLATVAYPKD